MDNAFKFMKIDSRVEGIFSKSFKHIKCSVIVEPSVIEDLSSNEISELDAFHATNVYMVERNDDYYCGIRADHFVVEEGWSEFNEGLNYLVTANHKGIRRMTLVSMEV